MSGNKNFNSSLIAINELFNDLADELLSHMQKEEQILFPYIKKLVVDESAGKCNDLSCFGTVIGPISVMEQEHENAGVVLKQLYQLSNGYPPPKDACKTFLLLNPGLKTFDCAHAVSRGYKYVVPEGLFLFIHQIPEGKRPFLKRLSIQLLSVPQP